MVCKALIALCIFTAGLRVQGSPTSAPSPVALMTKITPPTATWTTSAQDTAMATTPVASGTHNASVLHTTAASLTSQLPKNISADSREKAGATSPALKKDGKSTDPSPTELSSTSSEFHVTSTPEEHSLGNPEASVPATGSHSPVLMSSRAPTSTSRATSPPTSLSASITSNHSSTVPNTQPTDAPMTPSSPAEGHSSSHTPTSHVTAEPEPKDKSPQDAEPGKVTCESETTTPFLIMQEVENALSSGSIAAITVTVIAVVLLVFGAAAYLKIRHSSSRKAAGRP